jgi:hypothetical protein
MMNSTKLYRRLYLGLAALAGCATTASYIYSPERATHLADGYPAAAIAVPPEAPQGQIEVTSFGIVGITPDGSSPMNALHVRLAIANNGDTTPWEISPNDQLVEIAGEGQSRPMFVNTDVRTLPTVTVTQHERRVLDFYYPLPPAIASNDDLPAFDFLWQVTTPSRPFASRTRFDRIEEESPTTYTNVVLYTGWGPLWWYDPFFPGLVFHHYRPFRVYQPGRVVISHPPTWHYRPGHGRR